MRLWTFSTFNPQERNKICSFIWQALNLSVYSLCILQRYPWKCTIGQGLPLWEQCVTIPKKFDTNSDIFFYSNFFDTESKTIQKIEKFQNREVSKPKRHTLVVRTNTLVFQRAGRTIQNMSNFKNRCGVCSGSGLFGNSWPKWLLDGLTENNDV